MTDAKPIIELRNLSFSYNGRPVIENVSLDILEGEFCAVIGPNGGGKTTLLKLMLGLVKPCQGTALLFGAPPEKTARLAGYVPQDTRRADGFPATVRDVALMGRLSGRFGARRYTRADREAAREALVRMGMWELRDRRIGELSGGQRQRVQVARALATGSRLLLLDEPATGVDKAGRGEMYELLRELNTTTTILVVSHELFALSSYVKSVACVNKSVHYHGAAEMTQEMLDQTFHCPVDLVAHGLPHRVLRSHGED
jgi:zinc transport system ATP-binding protein